MSQVEFKIVCIDVTAAEVDVLALKYAQGFHGADSKVAENIPEITRGFRLGPGTHATFPGDTSFGPQHILFLGVEQLWKFDYSRIRQFGRDAVRIAAQTFPKARILGMTIHGVGYGLDEQEAFRAQLAGAFETIEAGQTGQLEQIWIVERNRDRAERLKAILSKIVPSPPPALMKAARARSGKISESIDAGLPSQKKQHVFVAMPFSEEMEDVFEFGIKGPVNAAGLLCERVDMAVFTGDILERIKERIESASLVIADLTGSNPNVYLEVGYAWGCRRPTLLIARGHDDLKFDVRSHRCISYSSIRDLREQLRAELPHLTEKE